MTGSVHNFGPYRFDASRMLLLRDGVPVMLGGRAAAILASLLASNGRVVGKDKLMAAAWPDTAVEESNLSVQISKLRRAVGDERIRTVERVGYQFVMPRDHAGAPRSRPQNAFPSIVVMAEAATEMREGLAGVCIALARFKTLRVIALPYAGPTASVQQAARELDADYAVVLSSGTRGGVSVSLSDGESGVVLWGAAFGNTQDDGPEDRIAASIESEVQAAEIVRGARGSGPGAEAYDLFLRGRRALNSSRADDNRIAYSLFMGAIDLEPENAAYLAAATEAMHHRLAVGWESLGSNDKQVCRELAYRTLAVAGGDAVAIALVGNALFTADEEDLGLALCRRALTMNPTSQLVLACAMHAESWGGSMGEVERISRMGVELAPNDPGQRFALGGMASAAIWRGDYETALHWARRSLAFGPGYAGAHFPIIDSLLRLGDREAAERQLRRYSAMAPGTTIRSIEHGQHLADRSRISSLIDSLRLVGMPER